MICKQISFFVVLISSLFALPSGGQVVQGQAALFPSSDTLQVQANGKAVLHWDAFNIGKGEAVHFIQSEGSRAILNRVPTGPMSEILGRLQANCPVYLINIGKGEAVHFIQSEGSRAILNRVPTGPMSEILGRLQANCPVYLINPKGVYIGSSACIETAGFLASTADLSNEAFLQGSEMLFQEFGDGRIVNLGQIHASDGDVVLIARAIENQGRIQAPNGSAVLTTQEMMLRPDTKECVFIRPEKAVLEGEIQNSGKIEALAVELRTCSPHEQAIRHTGFIEAVAAVAQNGRIYLIAEEGGTVVDGVLIAEEGEIRILGQEVELLEQARVDASGPVGGRVFIGGGDQGANPNILNAQNTYAAAGTEISADGWAGDAGRIVIWAEGETECTAKISAAALGEGGNGGFVEVSGKNTLITTSVPNLLSRSGDAGTLLLDPGSITISSGAASGPNTYGSTFINTTLASGNLTITTATATVGVETLTIDNTVTGANEITWNTGNTLSLTGRRNVVIQTGVSINATGAGNLSIAGGTTPAGVTGMSIGTATIQVGGILSITGVSTSGTGLIFTGTTLQSGGAMTVSGTSSGGLNIYGADIQDSQMTTGTGTLQVTGNSSTNSSTALGAFVRGLHLGGANISMNSTSGNISVTGLGGATNATGGNTALLVDTTTSFTLMTAGSISITGTGFSTGSSGTGIFLPAGTQITSTNSSVTVTGTSGPSGGFGISMGSTICQAATTITMMGVSRGNVNVYGTFIQDSQITATGTIQITGNSSSNGATAAGAFVRGLGLSGSMISITSTNGDISLTGLGGATNASGTGNNALLINTTTSCIISTAGAISLSGTGFSTANSSSGIVLPAGTQITSTNSSVTMTGTTGPSGGFGISMIDSICQAATFLTMTGTSRGNPSVDGVLIQNSQLTSGTGDIVISGDSSTNGSTGGAAFIRGLELTGATVSITSTSGNISLTGFGGATNAPGPNHGLFINTTTSCIISTAGSISLTGRGFSSATGSGIVIPANATISSSNSSVNMDGRGTSSGPGLGISITGTSISASGGNSLWTGIGGGTSGIGISISGASAISGVAGSLTLQGTGGPGSTGILKTAGTISTTGGAALNLTGTGGSGASIGVSLTGGTVFTTGGGNISITGTSNGGGASSHGINIVTNVTAAGTGTITALGTGGTGASSYGLFVSGASGLIQTANGLISLTGTGRGSSTNAEGIGIFAAARVNATGIGGITLNGTGSTTGSTNSRGIIINGASSAATTVSGNIIVNGTGGNGAATGNSGLEISAAGRINSTSGSISGTCLGGTGTTTCRGIFITGASSQITTATGGINLTGTGRGTTTNNQGIFLTTAGTITTTNNGPITLAGTGSSTGTSSNEGIFMTAATTAVSTVTGNIQMTGTTGAGTTNAITVDTSANVLSSTAGLVTLTSAAGRVVVQNNSAVRTQGVGGPGVNDIAVNSNGLSVLAGATGRALISTVNGNVNVTSIGSVVLTASTVANAFAQITVGNAANTIGIQMTSLSLTASSASGSLAEISTVGGAISIDGSGAIALTGGTNTNTQAQIITRTTALTAATDVIRIGQISPTKPTSITLLGNTGATSQALIASDQGGNIVSTITGLYTLTGGTGTTDARAGIYSGFTGGTSTGSGNINLSGSGFLLTGGASGAGTKRAEIVSGSGGGSVILSSSGGNVTLQAGGSTTADGSNANIEARAINGSLTLLGSGIVTLNGGSTANQHSYIRTTAASGANPIAFTCNTLSINGSTNVAGTNSSSEIITSFGSLAITCNGVMSLTGGAAAGATARAAVNAGNTAHTVDIAMQELNIRGSATVSASAEIVSLGGLISVDWTGVGTGAILLQSRAAEALLRTATTVLTVADEAIHIGQVLPPTSITITGGTGASRALLVSGQGGNILSTISGLYTITGGTGPVDARAGIYTGYTGGTYTGSGNLNLTGSGFVLTGGASGAGVNRAEIISGSGGGILTLSSSGGNVTLQAGGGSTADGTNASIEARAINGSLTLLGSGIVALNGGSTANQHSYIRTTAGSGSNPISFTCDTLTINGSTNVAGTNSSSEIITSFGSLGVTCNGVMSLTGGAAAGATARAAVNAGNTTHTVSVTMQELNIQGSSSTATLAEIASLGGTVSVDWTGAGSGAILLQSNAADAFIRTTTNALTTANDAIRIGQSMPPVSVTLTGGTGATSRALLASEQGGNIVANTTGVWSMTAGSGGTDSRAGIFAGLSGGSGNITAGGASFSLTGGSGTGANFARISAPAAGGSISLTASGGPSVLQGGSGSNTAAQIVTNGVGTIDITAAGSFSALGGSGDSSLAQVSATGAVTMTTGGCTLTGGSSALVDGSNAVIESTGMNGSVTLAGGALALNGGTAADQHGYIRTTSGGGTNPIEITCTALQLNGSASSNGSAEISTVIGDIGIDSSGDVNLTRGSALGTDALVHSTMQGTLTLDAQNLNIGGGLMAAESGLVTQSGDVTVTCTGNCVLSAPAFGTSAVIQTFGSDLTLSVAGSINLIGFATISTPAPTGNLLAIAGVDITIDSSSQIVAAGTVMSSLTLVVDNNFPTAPNVGPGQFFLDAGGNVLAGMGTEVRIYTARRSQNLILSPINGQLYSPGPFGVDSSTELWSLYYPDGGYGGESFNLYYKEPQAVPPTPPIPVPTPVNQRTFFNLVAVNLIELPYLLPVLDVVRKHYHFRLCDRANRLRCDPDFSPYGSFIFEDDVYWIPAM